MRRQRNQRNMAAPCSRHGQNNQLVFTCAQDVWGIRTTCTWVNLASWNVMESRTCFSAPKSYCSMMLDSFSYGFQLVFHGLGPVPHLLSWNNRFEGVSEVVHGGLQQTSSCCQPGYDCEEPIEAGRGKLKAFANDRCFQRTSVIVTLTLFWIQRIIQAFGIHHTNAMGIHKILWVGCDDSCLPWCF